VNSCTSQTELSNLIVVVFVKPFPVSVVKVPPLTLPVLGDIDSTVGIPVTVKSVGWEYPNAF